MTRVQFYHNASHPLVLACELAQRAWEGGRRALVLAPGRAVAARIDEMLWSLEPLSFVPHVRIGSALADETPIVIASNDEAPPQPARDILLNLTTDVPPGFDAYRFLVEIVGREDADRIPARARWKHYKSLGHPLQAFDAELREAM